MPNASEHNRPNPDASNLDYKDTFDFEGKTWSVEEVSTYNWQDGYFSKEFKVRSGYTTRYLCMDEDDEWIISWVEEIQTSDITGDVPRAISRNRQPPQQVVYKGINFDLDEESRGEYRGGDGSIERLINWDYFDQSEQKLLSIEEWDDGSIESYFGRIIQLTDLSNIQQSTTQNSGNAFLEQDNNSSSVFTWIIVGVIGFMTLFFNICSRSGYTTNTESTNNTYSYDAPIEEGLDKVIKTYATEPNYTILLQDMDLQNEQPVHKYQVILQAADSSFTSVETDWQPISSKFFVEHENHLGMELATKTNGTLNKSTAPAGYGQFIGNGAYGTWEEQEQDTTRNWRFHQRYAPLRGYFYMSRRPAYYHHYNNYDRNYRPVSRTYYGPSNYYGTQNFGKTDAGQKSSWIQKTPTFRERVRRFVRTSSNNNRTNTTNRIPRNSSRYSNRSPSRSRGGGFGGK